MLLKFKPTTNFYDCQYKKEFLKFDQCPFIIDEASLLRIFGKVPSEKLGTLNKYNLHTVPGFQMVENQYLLTLYSVNHGRGNRGKHWAIEGNCLYKILRTANKKI